MKRFFLYFAVSLWYSVILLTGEEHFNFHPDLRILSGTLPNGFQYAIFKNQKPEGKVFIRLDVNVGSFFEQEKEEGFAHLLEHATFLGSENFPQGFRKGLRCLGVDSTAFTEILYTKYIFELRKNSVEAIDKTLLAASDVAFGRLTFDEKSLLTEKGVVLSEIDELRNSDQKFSIALIRGLYRESEILKKLPIEREGSVKSATVDQLRSFHMKHYTPDRMFLVVAGDIDNINEIESKIRKLFSPLNSNQSPDQSDKSFDLHLKEIYKNDTSSIVPDSQCRCFLNVNFPKDDPSFTFGIARFRHKKVDSFESHKEDFILECLINCFKDRIQMLNQKQNTFWFYAKKECHLNMCNTPYDGGYCTVSFSINDRSQYDSQIKNAFRLLCEEWEKLLIGGISQIELQKFITEKKQPQKIKQRENYKDSGKMMEEIVTFHRNKAAYSVSLKDQSKPFERIPETLPLDDFKRIHQKQKTDNRIGLSFSINLDRNNPLELCPQKTEEFLVPFYEMIHDSIEAVNNSLETQEVFTDETSKEDSLRKNSEFPMEELRKEVEETFSSQAEQDTIDRLKEEIVNLEEITNLGITRFSLKNGIRVNLKPLSEEGRGISIKLSLGNGKLSYDLTEGYDIPDLIEFYYDSFCFSDFFRKKGVSFSFRPEINEFSTKLSSIDENDTNMMLVLLTNYLKFDKLLGDPGHNYLTEDRTSKFKEELSSRFRDAETDLNEFGYTRMLEWITSCRLFGIPSVDDVQKLSNLTNFQFSEILRSLRNSYLEVSIVGSFNKDEIISSIVKTLGRLPSREKNPSTIHMPSFTFPEEGTEEVFSFDNGSNRTFLIPIFEIPGLQDIKNTINFAVLGKIIKERIFEQIRTKEGKIYTPDCFQIGFKFLPYGAMGFYLSLDPSDVDGVKKEVLHIISQVREEGVNQEEFDIAKQDHIHYMEELYNNNDELINLISSSQRDPLFAKNFDSSQNYLQDVSIQDVNECAKNFLKDPVFARIENKRDQTR